jgi:hypothetical protein
LRCVIRFIPFFNIISNEISCSAVPENNAHKSRRQPPAPRSCGRSEGVGWEPGALRGGNKQDSGGTGAGNAQWPAGAGKQSTASWQRSARIKQAAGGRRAEQRAGAVAVGAGVRHQQWGEGTHGRAGSVQQALVTAGGRSKQAAGGDRAGALAVEVGGRHQRWGEGTHGGQAACSGRWQRRVAQPAAGGHWAGALAVESGTRSGGGRNARWARSEERTLAAAGGHRAERAGAGGGRGGRGCYQKQHIASHTSIDQCGSWIRGRQRALAAGAGGWGGWGGNQHCSAGPSAQALGGWSGDLEECRVVEQGAGSSPPQFFGTHFGNANQ